ncbi:MAG: DNA cytosine methyltransferase [Flavobacteriales bacterium]|nr:DNA cytosine methyltransferase [Flavobacteriales bacterium]
MTRRSTIRPTAISLFSGAGGMDIGFERAGFRTLAAIEKDPSCCKTLRENLPVHTRVIEADIRDIKGDDLLSDLGLERGEVDVIYGGPPCQSFSLAGKRRGLEDERGMLVGEFIRLVHEILPRSFVMENVKGMANWEGGRVLEFIEESFADPIIWKGRQVHFSTTHRVLDAADFGVAQHRERIFIVGNRMAGSFKFPAPTHGASGSILSPFVTSGDVLAVLPDAAAPSEVALRVSGTIKARIAAHGY